MDDSTGCHPFTNILDTTNPMGKRTDIEPLSTPMF